MKVLTLVTVVTLFAAPTFAASKTMTGMVSDSKCGLSHQAMLDQAKDITAAQCTQACIKAGAKYVFTSGGKVYEIANQDQKDLAANGGKTVRVTADVEGTTLTINKIGK